MSIHTPRHRLARRPAFTLIEMVLAIVVIAVLLGSTQSVLLFANRAANPGTATPTATVDAQAVANLLLNELRYAITVTELTSTAAGASVTFTVADRNNDAANETIRYTWAGPGTPLKRIYNGVSVDLLTGVQEFSLARETRDQPLPQTTSYGPETTLWSFDATSGLADQSIKTGQWFGQYLKPMLAANATAWRITRLKFSARIHGSNNGQTNVQVRDVDSANLPSSTILQEVPLIENTLASNYQWCELAFGVGDLPPSRGVCVVFKWISDSDSADVRYQSAGGGPAGPSALQGTDATSWSALSGSNVLLYVYGCVKTPDAPQSQTLLTGVRVTLSPTSDSQGRISATAVILNEPDVSGI